MIKAKVNCRNMNHGKSNSPVVFCPNCGERFRSGTATESCDETKHNYRRKTGCTFCFDCGKNLKAR